MQKARYAGSVGKDGSRNHVDASESLRPNDDISLPDDAPLRDTLDSRKVERLLRIMSLLYMHNSVRNWGITRVTQIELTLEDSVTLADEPIGAFSRQAMTIIRSDPSRCMARRADLQVSLSDPAVTGNHREHVVRDVVLRLSKIQLLVLHGSCGLSNRQRRPLGLVQGGCR